MHDLNLNLFYETSFDVEATGGDGDALWALVMSIRLWICGKWERQGVQIDRDVSAWSRFKAAQCGLGDERGVVRLESARVQREDGELLWGCKITETILGERRAPRRWCTEVGFSSRSPERGTVSIVLSYGDRPGFLGELQDEPLPTIPGLIGDLLGNNHLRCTVSGRPANVFPTGLREGDFDSFWGFVSDPSRAVPVVYVSPRFPSGGDPCLAVDPRPLARALGPSAAVFYSVDRGFCAEMRQGIGSRDLRCENGLVRVYAEGPRFSEAGDARRHRFFTFGEVESMGEERFVRLVRRALAQDVDFYEGMTRVGTIQELARRQRIERIARRHADERVKETEDQLLEDTVALERDLRAARSELDEAKGEAHALSAKCAALEQALSARGSDAPAGLELGSWPMSPQEIGATFRAAFPDSLDFTERGWKSLDDCRSDAKVLWNALYDLCTIAHGLYEGDGNADFKREFDRRSRFEYAPSAGMMTRKDNRLMAGYRDVYQGREINCETHLKAGTKESDPGFIRVYFAYDRPSGRVVVSGCGGHRENFSTRKVH